MFYLYLIYIAEIIYMSNKLSNSSVYQRKQQKYQKEFLNFKNSWFYRLLFRGQEYSVNGPDSIAFNRRTYEQPIECLQFQTQDLGWTNNILYQRQKQKKLVHLFVPVYVSLKIKSIHQIELNQLLAQVNCVLIVRIYTAGLPESIKRLLQSKIFLQVNRGESFQLKDDDAKINMKWQGDFLRFIVRNTFPVQIYDDVFLSPFEILNLVLTITLNSQFMSADKSPEPGYKYQISFNCMRNPSKIPISYVSQCRLGVYDLAEQKLQCYPSQFATFDQIKKNFFTLVEGKAVHPNEYYQQTKPKIKKYNIKPRRKNLTPPLIPIPQKHTDKIEYFQYSHFVIPVYKYPLNAWATIFIPLILLACLSISMFFHEATLVDKIGSVATFVLGFIALIPSIKGQLPPSQRITLSQIIVYIQAVNCIISLTDSAICTTKKSNWYWKNKIFIVSLTIHIICIGIAFGLLFLHKFFWEPKYNILQKVSELTPNKDRRLWDNPYCDQKFIRFNSTTKNKVQLYKNSS